ncbi:MAG: flagellin [Selenomonadaceae bacterium]|nr:flagellin [Selenomonadaceae bacterium]
MKVKNNLGAIRTLNTLGKNAGAVQKNLRKVSTGEKINSAADDASAYSISERMREKIRSLDQANQNTQNDMAMMRTAEGAVANIVDTLRTLKQKAIDSANDSNTDEDRRIMQKEVDQFIDQIDDNALVTFNGKFLVNGNMSSSVRTRTVLVCEGVSWSGGTAGHDLAAIMSSPMTGLRYPFIDEQKPAAKLGIEETDIIKISHVINGETYTRTETIGQQSLGAFLVGRIGNDFGRDYSYGKGVDIILPWIGSAVSIAHAFVERPPIGMISSGNLDYFSAGAVSITDEDGYTNYYLVDNTNTPLVVSNKHIVPSL